MISHDGVFLSDIFEDTGSGGAHWGPGGFGSGYPGGDSGVYVNSYGLAGGVSWNSGFGAPSMISISNPDNIDQNGQDIFDAGWGHARRMEAPAYFGVYWTPNNSVCWRRPSTWPSDCASAPAGDNPPTDPPRLHDSVLIQDYGTTFTACAFRSNADSGFFSPNTLEITSWIGNTEVNLAEIQEHNSGGFSPVVRKGAIEAIRAGSSTFRPVTAVRMRGVTGAILADGAPTVRFYLVEASTTVPAAGPYLVLEAAGGAHGFDVDWYFPAWKREGLEDAVGGWTEITSLSTGSTTGPWVDIDMALLQPGIDAQYARAAASGLTLSEWGGEGPSHFIVAAMDSTHLSDTAPVKDTTNQDGFHLYGFDTGTFAQLEVDVGGPSYRYVMYDQPTSVPGTPEDTVKFGSSMTYPGGGARLDGDAGSARAYALKTGPTGVQLIGTLDWDMAPFVSTTNGFGFWVDYHPLKWLQTPRRVGVIHQRDFSSFDQEVDYFTIGDTAITQDTARETENAREARAVTGDGNFYIVNHNATYGVFDLYKTSPEVAAGEYIDTFDFSGDGSSVRSTSDFYSGPGNTIIGYAYDTYLEIFTCTETGITWDNVFVPTWEHGHNFFQVFTNDYLHRITWEPGSSRIWVTAYMSDDGTLSSGQQYEWYLTAFYDLAADTWSNIIYQLGDYDWYTYCGDEWGAVGFSSDGPFLTGTTTPNFLDHSGGFVIDNSLDAFAAYLGVKFIRGITVDGFTIDWAGDLRRLMYVDVGYWGWGYFFYGDDPMSGSLWTGLPHDMRVFYNGADQEIWVQQLSALIGSGSYEFGEVMVNSYDGTYLEVAWYGALPLPNLAGLFKGGGRYFSKGRVV